jgi:hypothetical protein
VIERLRGPRVAVAAVALLALGCTAPEPTPAEPAHDEADGCDAIANDPVRTMFWAHVGLGIVPELSATSLLNADVPDDVAYVVAINRGADPAQLVAAGIPLAVSVTAIGMSFANQDSDSLLLYASDWQILSWLPIRFHATSATGPVYVVKKHH